ncbi:MAG: hypothetical protein KC731_12785 [Myxococcales bacterium]|nr:hypothetical protein [Myxococcales bacterium]
MVTSKRGLAGLLSLGLSVAAGCGARSALDTGASDRGGALGHGGSGGTGGAGGEGGSTVPPLPCRYDVMGGPVVAVSIPDRHAESPAMVTTNGDPGARPLEVALQYVASGGSSPLHPDNPVVRLMLQADTPEVTEGATVVAGVESHSYGLMVRSTSGDRLLLTWFTDLAGSGRLAARTIGVADNSLGAILDVDAGASGAAGLAAGAGLTSAGSLSGSGHAITWRRNPNPGGPRPTSLAILDDDGALQAGPHDLTPFLDTPPGAHVAWTGSSYVAAVAYGDDCPVGEALCTPRSVTVLRYHPPADGGDPIEVVATIAADVESIPQRPRLLNYTGRTWLVWGESGSTTASDQRVRLVELDPSGEPLGASSLVAEVPLGAPVQGHASDQGIVLAWPAPSGDDGPPDMPGVFELHVLALDHDGNELGVVDPIPITTPQAVGPSIVHLGGSPRSLALAWSGYREGGGTDVTYLARLRCVEAVAR